MQIKKWMLTLLMVNVGVILLAQKVTLSGYVKDAGNGEDLIGATIYNTNIKTGTTTNSYGFYSLTVPSSDSLGLVVSFIGYVPKTIALTGKTSQVIVVNLESSTTALDEVVISVKRNSDNFERASMGTIDVPMKQITSLPAIGGETDVLKVIQLLPGVQSGKEGTTGFHVRGGNSDQNLILLDEATVYNPNHLFGLFSTFNNNALNNVTLIKGGFPAEYGGRLSSILEINMKEGNKNRMAVSGGIGLLSSNLTLEGPINKGKGSYIVSGRRSYIDILARPFIPKAQAGSNYYFYDINAKVNYTLGDKDRVFLSYFNGLDNAQYVGASSLNYGIDFGNKTATLRWNHLFSNKIFSNTSIVYNDFHNSFTTKQGKYVGILYSGIQDLTAKTDWEIHAGPNNKIKFGANYANNTFIPASTSYKSKIDTTLQALALKPDSLQHKYSNSMAFYASDEFKIIDAISLNLGFRIPVFQTATTKYTSFEPRITAKISTGISSSIKASYTEMNQFLHLVPSTTASLPTDVWISSSDVVKPEVSKQVALGYFKNFDNNAIETSVEAYYKTMSNQVLFKEGTQTSLTDDIDQQLTFGSGVSYGVEFFARKNFGKLTGWASYTLSWTNQLFPDLNYGNPFPYTYDKRHNISLAATYDLSNKWKFAADWIFTSGGAYTLPLGKIPVYGGGSLYDLYYNDYTKRNNYRYRPYHRLDVSLIRQNKEGMLFGKKFTSEWVFSVYNLYSRMNPYFVYLSVDPQTKKPSAKEVSLLPAIPSISWNFKF
ncbi:MAG: carboxypeptidase-like regulatory domain-containing protein [Prolixibacteraceae bacterium]